MPSRLSPAALPVPSGRSSPPTPHPRSKTPKARRVIKSYRDLNVNQVAYSLAMEVFQTTKKFPREELYSLTDQLRKASRSVAANIVEGWVKSKYESVFKHHLLDSIGSCGETRAWLDFALDCKYIPADVHKSLADKYDKVSRMLHGLLENWKTYKNESSFSLLASSFPSNLTLAAKRLFQSLHQWGGAEKGREQYRSGCACLHASW